MSEWVYFLHPPRDDFAATMTDEENAVWQAHAERLESLLAAGIVVLAGPTLGKLNTGIVIFEAENEEAATAVMEGDPAIAGGYARGEMRQFRVSFLRGGPTRPSVA
ncbi:MAG TPA: YciI family protein [Candidatus Binatia bacterium]|nr:YciI family protein [Candidatus Binatia bacterium]